MPRRVRSSTATGASGLPVTLEDFEPAQRWHWLAFYARIGLALPPGADKLGVRHDSEEERAIQTAEGFRERFNSKVWELRDHKSLTDQERFDRLYRWLVREGLQDKADRWLAYRVAQYARHEAWKASRATAGRGRTTTRRRPRA